MEKALHQGRRERRRQRHARRLCPPPLGPPAHQLCRHGRGQDNLAWIRARVFPLRQDVTLDMVEAAMAWYAGRGMLLRYQVDGRPYFQLANWTRYQGNTSREAPSDYPPPDPPRCSVHRRPAPAPPLPASIADRAPTDLAGRITDLDRKIEGLSRYLHQRLQETDGLSTEQYAALLNLYGQLVSRLGRLMRDQRALSDAAADGIAGAIPQALDELSTELGADL